MNDSLLLLINGWAGKNSLLDGVMIFSAVYLIYAVLIIAAVCLGICLYKREWRSVVYFCIALAVTFVVLKLMTHINFDHRPFMDHKLTQLIPHAAGKSFPSDHTTSSAAVALGILFFTRFKKIGGSLLVCACVIGFARIFVGVHYPADIAAGLVTGLIGCGLVMIIKGYFNSRSSQPMRFSSQK
jgi:undecaprenyl-diphosphatase